MQLLEEAKQFGKDLTAWRRHMHRNPELGFEEQQTSAFVIEKLHEIGCTDVKRVAKTGVIAMLHGDKPGKTVALRADMDALPILDEKDVDYKSMKDGIAHLCGHDGHTAILLGAAKLLMKHPPQYGSVKLIFQPAEEGLFGAETLIKHGVLTNPDVSAIAGLHVNPDVPTGQVTCSEREVCAAADFFNLEIIGEGGHAAHPHRAKDSITITAEVISALQQLVSREIDPLAPTVMTIGQIHGGTADNAIAPRVKMGGTVRTLDNEVRYMIEEKMNRLVKGITEAFGVQYSLEYNYFYPALLNETALVPTVKKAVSKTLGEERFHIAKPSMGGEDFSFYANEIPGVFFRLGVRNEQKQAVYPLHHPKFDLDENALPNGSAILAQWALDHL
ncbi:M20 metallopeptidase family protein [Virgibacillus ihumii]|uniref:M20 metallopeptidase family protein n=1 Tax=Virgibacillus ihumii TaxID=2686091 RepID=UPI001FE61A7F|nr:M20 family metallopeptidase [Virgibacillus ihumii]